MIGIVSGYTISPTWSDLSAEKGRALSIATGWKGGMDEAMGGGFAYLLSKHLDGAKVKAENTASAIQNSKLIESRKADLAFFSGEIAYLAYKGLKAFENKVPIRGLLTPYSKWLQVVALDQDGINSINHVQGKRVSIGAPRSGTEVMALRLLEILGIDPEKDIRCERLNIIESVTAMKQKKIDIFIWYSGISTILTDLASTPGIRPKILDLGGVVSKFKEKYGPAYFNSVIHKGSYPGVDEDVSTIGEAVILCCHEKMEEPLAYKIAKVIIEKKGELIEYSEWPKRITIEDPATGSPIPYHPGSMRYFEEKGIKVKE
jgi:hypothetical protein